VVATSARPGARAPRAVGQARRALIAYSYQAVGKQNGPGDETGARGLGKALYFHDPNKHLLEIRYYDSIS
jgi:hypothetical protein